MVLDEVLPESEEVDAGFSADFVSPALLSPDLPSDDLLSPSAEAFMSDRFDFEA